MIENPPIFRLSLSPGIETRSVEALAEPSPRPTAELLQEAERLGVFPAVYQNVRATQTTELDESWERRLRDVAVRNLTLEKEQTRLLDAFRDEGIPCIPAKGVQLTRLLYPDLSWREIEDIDFIVPPEELSPAYRCLKDLGLTDTENPWNANALSRLARRPAFLHPELHLTGPYGLWVELHWDWTGDRFPERSPSEDPEAYLVYLCRHAGKHFWSSLRWSADIEVYVRKFGDALDWQLFWRLARAAGAERSCAASFQLCARLFERAVRLVEQEGPQRVGRKLSEQAARSLSNREPSGLRGHALVWLLEVDSPKQRALRCLSLLVPAPRHWTHPSGRKLSSAGVWLGRYWRLSLQSAAALCPFAAWKRRLRKAALFSAAEWFVLAKAWWMLAAVKPAIRFMGLSRLERWAKRAPARASLSENEYAYSIQRTVYLVDAAARNHLGAMKCLPRSLVTARLLAGQGIDVGLRIGMREEGGRLVGHAWVEYQQEPINDSDSLLKASQRLAIKEVGSCQV